MCKRHMLFFQNLPTTRTFTQNYFNKNQPEFTRVTKRIQRVKSAIRLQQGDSLLSLVSAQSLSELMDKEAVTYNSGAGPTAPAPQQQEQQHHHHHVFFNSPDRPRNSPLRHRRRLLSERLLKDEVTFEDEPTLLHLMASRLSAGAVSSAPSEGAHEQRPVGVASAAMPTSPPLLPRCVQERRRARPRMLLGETLLCLHHHHHPHPHHHHT